MKTNFVPSSPGPQKYLVTIVAAAVVVTAAALATASQVRYVKPSAEVVVRTGQGTNFKIIAMVKDGSSLSLLEEQGNYSRVRLQNGNEGWILSRFLSPTPPLTEMVTSLRKENDEIKEREAETKQQLEETDQALEQARVELQTIALEKDRIHDEYQTLLQDTSDVIELKELQQRTEKKNEELTARIATIEEENRELQKDKKLHWFLAGAGVFLVGILFGKLPGSSRRKKSSLLQ
ncbi:TIGR04211 family SH3 domain-containing protein [Desulforhopalus singaporensis]|uniref:SH3 domain protein n=1 Tax=Desulforhopalus singaporensis TaxID=91360 RepID=A0A1H0NZT2_9BACT|nr:TIGR04211 family SH3 domain-containing protein [Desulforhopalus singaporensis]SDO98026.1 SH3 domain protein [Desulforhopalus singaporensis]